MIGTLSLLGCTHSFVETPHNEHLSYLLPLTYIILALFATSPMRANIEGFEEGAALARRPSTLDVTPLGRHLWQCASFASFELAAL